MVGTPDKATSSVFEGLIFYLYSNYCEFKLRSEYLYRLVLLFYSLQSVKSNTLYGFVIVSLLVEKKMQNNLRSTFLYIIIVIIQ